MFGASAESIPDRLLAAVTIIRNEAPDNRRRVYSASELHSNAVPELVHPPPPATLAGYLAAWSYESTITHPVPW